MTKPFSALLGVALSVALAPIAAAETASLSFDAAAFTAAGLSNTVGPLSFSDLPFHAVAPPTRASYTHSDAGAADASYDAIMRRLGTQPDQWSGDALPYRVAMPGPSYVGVISPQIPEGWVVTLRCLDWDTDYSTEAEQHEGCYVFEMRSLAEAPTRPPHP
ncbi:hypothetical protein A8B78_01100 [Jannaschia sp. EhC01]|nr:hypothetical protein A8B78_01100 [Jannaschia sp. EhC01]